MIDRLTEHFGTALELPPDAVQWLLDLWRVTQMLDDVVDNDPIDREELNSTIFLALVGLPANPFFQAHRINLLPVLATSVLKWQASNFVEQNGSADEKSFVWRSAYYDVVLMVVMLCHGVEKATNAADYVKEFSHA